MVSVTSQWNGTVGSIVCKPLKKNICEDQSRRVVGRQGEETVKNILYTVGG